MLCYVSGGAAPALVPSSSEATLQGMNGTLFAKLKASTDKNTLLVAKIKSLEKDMQKAKAFITEGVNSMNTEKQLGQRIAELEVGT